MFKKKKKNTTTLLQNLFIHGIFQNEIIKVLLRGQMQKTILRQN